MRLAFLAPAALAALLAAPAMGEPYVVDKSHAVITFRVDHLGFSAVHGMFREFEAQIDFDPNAVEQTRLRFVIDPASIDTFWDRRDADLRGPNFFDVENHPEIVFESDRVTPTTAETADVTGTLTIRGVSREVTLNARLNRLAPSPFDPSTTIAGFTVTGEIDRRDFGMTYAAPEIGAIIPIRIDLEISPAG